MASRPGRIPKPLPQRLRDLDDHLYLLAGGLARLPHDRAHLKAIAAELRTLICFSSGTEGLLWRLADELQVSDVLKLKCAEGVNLNHPLNSGLHFKALPFDREGEGHPMVTAEDIPLRYAIKQCAAVFVAGKNLTHEYLIKAIAQQMGSAHEDDGMEPALVDLGQIFTNGLEPYIRILGKDASLTLEVGERVLAHAIANHSYQRAPRVGY